MTTQEILEAARGAKAALALADGASRAQALHSMAAQLCSPANMTAILAANADDMAAAKGHISEVMLDRLALTEERIRAMAKGIEEVAALPDPVGRVLKRVERPNGLVIEKTAVPMGVIAIIYESRPNVTSDAAALAVKAGSACILRCGRDAWASCHAIVEALRAGLRRVRLPECAVSLIEDTSHASANELMTADGLVDLLIPRGGAGLIRACVENAKVPCIQTGTGICHVYVDKSADVEMAVSIAVDSKAQNVAVCNACETLLVHRDIAADFLPKLLPAMQKKHVRLPGDEATRAIIPVEAATEEDWRTEYLDYVLSIRVVDSLEAAIAHINRYGSHHTDCIVTRDDAAAKEFLTRVDSAGVYRNVSTRFADGFVYGFGAEVGIATGKLHARGPMGLDGLTTYKYKLLGDGQLMAEMKSGQRAYTHLVLHEDCPL